MYSTGTRIDQGQFSRDVVGTVVGEYLYIAARLSDRRWDLITDLCGDTRESLVVHSVPVNRRALYESSSPMGECYE
jgi:hypothetical protein